MSERKNNILLIGECGTGKTWVMKELIKATGAIKKIKLGTISYSTNDSLNVLGVYDGSTFEGSDRLSMAVMKDLDDYLAYSKGKTTVAEGDRFMNEKYISKTQSTVIKIKGDGKQGREQRGSNQSTRQLKAISTRVRNIRADIDVENSAEALETILKIIEPCKS